MARSKANSRMAHEKGDGPLSASPQGPEKVRGNSEDGQENHSQENLGWPRGFFKKIAGGWQGKPLERGDQGKYESRDDLP